MNRNKEYRAARRRVDEATVRIISTATAYRGPEASMGSTLDLLSAAREYGRAMHRLETMRR